MERRKPFNRTGKKKLIIAIMLQHEPFCKIFNCELCKFQGSQERNGCRKEKTEKVLDFDCICDGQKRCRICKGKGTFPLYRCPVVMANDQAVNLILPFFFHWKATNYMMFPDNKGRIYQPVKMLEAFTLLSFISNKREAIALEKLKNK